MQMVSLVLHGFGRDVMENTVLQRVFFYSNVVLSCLAEGKLYDLKCSWFLEHLLPTPDFKQINEGWFGVFFSPPCET